MSPYWSYYEPAKPKKVENGLKAKSKPKKKLKSRNQK